MDYAPFPANELLALADHFENISKAWNDRTLTGVKLRQECLDRAKICRDAVISFAAVRDRMHEMKFGYEHGTRPEPDAQPDDYPFPIDGYPG